jgi:hypothetical protein
MRLIPSSESTRLIAVAIVLLTAAKAVSQVNVNFNVAGPENWNTDVNWDSFQVPQAQFNEIAVIGSDRSAFVGNTPPNVGGIIISAGTLEIRPGGTLTSGSGSIVNGDVVVGQGAGVGNLIVRRGGTLNTQGLTTGGAATTQLTLGETGGAGIARLQTTGATLNRVTRIVGPNVNFSNAGDLILASPGVLNPVITGTTHSTISATGSATLGGTVRPELSGYTPVLGNSWNLVTAGQISGDFSAVDASLLPATPRGTGFTVSKTATTATLRYTNKLILSVDRNTGAARMENVVGGPIAIDGYTITSSGGNLDGAWSSLDDQNLSAWDEADNANASRLSEFNPSESSTINVGASLAIGSPFSPPAPTALGQAVEDLSFAYAVPGQGTVEGIVEYTGRRNNLVLTINPTTGAAAIRNESPYFNVDLDGYTITSTAGKLQTGNADWNSLDDQNLSAWDEADNSSAFRLTEFNPTGTTFMAGNGTVLNLGTPVDVAGGPLDPEDISFEFSIVTGGAGDYNGDGSVDAADYVVWRKTNINGQQGYLDWRANFGGSGGGRQTIQGIVAYGNLPTAGAASGIEQSAVPEPATVVSMLLLTAMIAASRKSLLRACGQRRS